MLRRRRPSRMRATRHSKVRLALQCRTRRRCVAGERAEAVRVQQRGPPDPTHCPPPCLPPSLTLTTPLLRHVAPTGHHFMKAAELYSKAIELNPKRCARSLDRSLALLSSGPRGCPPYLMLNEMKCVRPSRGVAPRRPVLLTYTSLSLSLRPASPAAPCTGPTARSRT